MMTIEHEQSPTTHFIPQPFQKTDLTQALGLNTPGSDSSSYNAEMYNDSLSLEEEDDTDPLPTIKQCNKKNTQFVLFALPSNVLT